MGTTTKILVAANSPAALHRLEQTLSGLQVEVAIRLRDVAKAAKEGRYALLVLCLGFDEQSAIELVHSLHGAQGAPRMAVVAVGCDDAHPASREVEARMRAAGACDFFELHAYPAGVAGDAALRHRLLASLSAPRQANAMARSLHRAALIAGSSEALARHLEVPEPALRRWIEGEEDPPVSVFLAALELVLDYIDRVSRPPS